MASLGASGKSGNNEDSSNNIDIRKQLFNDGAVGPIKLVQLPEDQITSLLGIMFDIDPKLFRSTAVSHDYSSRPIAFYNDVVRHWLDRHSVLAKAQVIGSGTGLHPILRFNKPVQFKTVGDRQRWAGIVRVVQRVLPVDADVPGITAVTRKIGSINSKNGKPVRLVAKGQQVTVDEVLKLFEEMRSRPFQTVARILFGSEHMSPCPICEGPDSQLSALDWQGRCYGRCGKISLTKLFDHFLLPRTTNKGS